MEQSHEVARDGAASHRRNVHFSTATATAAAPRSCWPRCITSPPHQDPGAPRRLQRFRRFLCNLATIVAFFYFLFLSSVAVITTTTSRTLAGQALLATWQSAHDVHITSIESLVDNVGNTMIHRAMAAAAFYVDSPNLIESNKTLTMLCAQMVMGDTSYRLRALSLASVEKRQYASCMHADPADPSLSTISAMMSNKDRISNIYYINPDTFTSFDPPIIKGFHDSRLTPEDVVRKFKAAVSTYEKLDAYLNGTLITLHRRDLWAAPPTQPNRLYFTLPVVMLGDIVPCCGVVHASDVAQTLIEGGTFFTSIHLNDPSSSTRVMALISQSLGYDDPQVLSVNWGQPVVHNPTFSILADTHTTYLTVSAITDPLMREAVTHIDLAALQHKDGRQSASFRYRGAPAIVTAWVYTSDLGLSLPIVVVSPQYAVAGPYMMVKDLCTGMVALAVLLLTALCYGAMDRYLSRPLRRVTAAMLASVRRRVRQPVRADACDVVQLKETRDLTAAYNAAMAQLRVVDEFVPDALRSSPSGNGVGRRGTLKAAATAAPPQLRQHYLSIVTVRVRSGGGGGVDTATLLREHYGDAGRGRFAAFVNAVAEATTHMANSGPFASAGALAAFVAAVRELCRVHHGTVHHVAPDRCVVHFADAVEAACSGAGGDADVDIECGATTDACHAVDFALALQQWVERRPVQEGAKMPDVRVLVDTGIFTSGQYRAAAQEQMVSVAFGRDVERAVGHVPGAIGVRVAVTEETAVRVRGCLAGGAPGSRECGRRQIPVEVLHTGRAGLDADVVILFEVLPGVVEGDEAWQLYTRCCFDGFSHMVHGDYAAALQAYKRVADISDLEPGLMPASLRREAARSDVTGGAVSVQVERLIGECERRLQVGCAEGFHRERHVPLGVDALLAGQPTVAAASSTAAVTAGAASTRIKDGASGRKSSSRSRSGGRSCRPASTARGVKSPRPAGSGTPTWRYVVCLDTATGPVRRALGGRPEWICDNYGLYWYLPTHAEPAKAADVWMRPYTVLGSTGTLSTATTLLLREGADAFSRVIEGAPDGPMSDELRSAVPVWTVSDATKAKIQRLFDTHVSDEHPNLLHIVAYSLSVEGCATMMWEYCPAGTLRDVIKRYLSLKPVSIVSFGLSVLAALSHLHAKGLVHGFLSLDAISVGSDGVCRLMNRYTDYELDNEVFFFSRTCCLSPAMAAGERPTPACDMFCYGLSCLEALSRLPPWTWAPAAAEQEAEGQSQRTDEELSALMAAGGQAFAEAVVARRVVPHTALLDGVLASNEHGELCRNTLRSCLAYDPSQRPTAGETWEVIRKLLDHGRPRN
ncbi:protein kinase-like protein [Leptomonas pyrrhocoris]|uniref:Protein kinase-like protein n=1 Tax=Leptomonas pyrrhocoris TaxID=157538 RepID=A0A0M9FYM9_LEPPY|nr:protein kinase-like protein [Leptomonas pyrrhocoris]KPA78810.1 protein kinase-like protein [Leptomonas pyrrhocoris]|eukprot:XP_015657249.1 protein kinase-like protein [Leptomonas pyrrhocoris]